MVDCLDTVYEWHYFAELLHIVPHFLVAGVENVWSIGVYHHVCLAIALGMTVSGYMRAAIEDRHPTASLSKLLGNYCARKTCANDGNILHSINIRLVYH